MNYTKYCIIIFLSFVLVACEYNKQNWRDEVANSMLLLGHRNWIVITDKAFPVQTKAGVEMIYTDDRYENILSFIISQLNNSTHIYGHFYQDKELIFLDDSICPGIENYRFIQEQYIPKNEVQYISHEFLLNKIDSISSFYNVLVVKTNLVLPYTSTFIELDCKYWNRDKQKALKNKVHPTFRVIVS